MALPVIESYANSDTAGNTGTNLNCNLPSGTVEGSFLVIIAGNDDTAAQTFSATGFTSAVQTGDATSDATLGILYGLATATTISTGYIDVVASGGANEIWVSILRISGVDEADPINTTYGSGGYTGPYDTIGSDQLYQAYAPAPTGGKPDCLSISAIAFDGGDVGLWRMYNPSNPDWNLGSSLVSGTGGTDASGAWYWTDYDTSGSLSCACTNSSNTVDGYCNGAIVLNAAASANYQNTDIDAAGTSTASGVTETVGYVLVDANSAGTVVSASFDMGGWLPGNMASSGQATAMAVGSFAYTPGWTMDANHLTMDANNSNHTMDGYHFDPVVSKSLIYSPIRRVLHTLVR